MSKRVEFKKYLGGPSKISGPVIEAICDLIKSGLSRAAAGEKFSIGRHTTNNWYDRGAELRKKFPTDDQLPDSMDENDFLYMKFFDYTISANVDRQVMFLDKALHGIGEGKYRRENKVAADLLTRAFPADWGSSSRDIQVNIDNGGTNAHDDLLKQVDDKLKKVIKNDTGRAEKLGPYKVGVTDLEDTSKEPDPN